MEDLASRLAHPVQLTTDGLKAYVEAVDEAFGDMVDHRILRKIYDGEATARTGYIERQNLTLRMSNRRYARSTNAFSKKLENHAHAVSLHFMAYNFVRTHRSLGRGVTPAMAVGLADRPWTHQGIINLVDSN